MVKVRNSIKWQDYASVLILISDLISLAVGNESIHAFIKPLVVPSIAFFFFSKELIKFKIGKYLALVLLFSWLGDLLLIFDSSLHLLLGLFSFLIAHFFYILIFSSITMPFKIRAIHTITILFFLILAVFILQMVWGKTENLQVPVLIYTIIISVMGVTATFNTIENRDYYSLFGALLFIISDALIALNTFHIVSVEGINFPFLIMFTYICAQLILVYSVVNQMNKN